MLKRSLIAVVAVAVLATVAQAGYIKTHNWPTTYVPQELTTIPVYVDVGYYVEVVKQGDNKIKMQQKTGTARDFQGTCTIKIKTNFNLTLSCNIVPTGDVAGTNWDATLEPENIDGGPGEKPVTVTASVKNLEIEEISAGTEAKVANVKISVVPR